MRAVVFPGQGSQYTGMGKSLYDNYSSARNIFSRINELAGFDLANKCFFGPDRELKDTAVQQLAILAVSLGAFSVFKENNIKIDYLAGLSLGEYSCLYPAGVLSLEEVVRLVQERSRAMQEASRQNPSCMFAVIGIEQARLQSGNESFFIANINSPRQIVISLAQEDKCKVKEMLTALGARVVELAVSGGFHSPFMEPARKSLEKVIEKMDFSDAQIPIVSNFTARGHTRAGEIKLNLLNQLTHTVLWLQSVEFMSLRGVSEFLEIGPSKVLRGIIRKINPQLRVVNIEKKDDFEENSID